MSLTRQDVEKIAHLARLSITDLEMPVYELSSVDTGSVEPMAHPLDGQHQRLRPDVISEFDHRDRYQETAPSVQSGLYVVPRVIE
jgi:aspartyl-tRNA(Asn)/glutamyl-tRNA(Gln) amidotransferase subunit C